MREILLTLHILGAAAWIGGGLYAQASFPRVAAKLGLKETAAIDEWLGPRYFGTAIGLVVITGVWLVLISDAFGWGAAFVWVGIGVVAFDGVLQGAILGPAMKRAVEQDGDLSGPGGRRLRMGAVISIALVVIAVWAMVAKPGV